MCFEEMRSFFKGRGIEIGSDRKPSPVPGLFNHAFFCIHVHPGQCDLKLLNIQEIYDLNVTVQHWLCEYMWTTKFVIYVYF